MLQLSFKKGLGLQGSGTNQRRRLAELRTGETAVLETLDLPEEVSQRLMELGFLPGHRVTPAHSAPGGDPRVFRVDGSEIALRRDTAARVWVLSATMTAAAD